MKVHSRLTQAFFRKFWRNEDGQILLLVPFIIILSLAIGGGVIDLGNAYLTQERLQSALDAGALAAAQDLGNGKTESTAVQDANTVVSANGFPNITFDLSNPSGSNQISIDKSTQTVQLSSDRQLPTYVMRVFGLAHIPIHANSTATLGISPVFQYALFANQTLGLSLNNITVNGNVHSNGSMSLNTNNGTVTGKVEVHGTYSAQGNDISYGSFSHPAPVITMPKFNITPYEDQATKEGTVYSSDLNISNQADVTFNNIVFVNGNVNIQANNLYCTMIVATGSITINVNNLTQINNQGLISIFAGGDITVEDNNSKSLDGFIYAPNGSIDVKGNTLQEMQGAVVGQSITLDQNTIGITYDPSVLTEVGGTGNARLVN